MRKKYDKALKAKIALEALKEIETVGEMKLENDFLKTSTNNCTAKILFS